MNLAGVLAVLLSSATLALAAPARHHVHPPAPYNYIADSKAPPDAATLSKRTVGGVTLSDGANFTGEVWYGVMPLAECIALNSYAGDLGSFRPDAGTECYLYQGVCNEDEDFADLFNDSPQCGELAETYPWIDKVESFMCFTQM